MPTLTLPLFPLATVLFPDGVLPLQIFEVRYLQMVGKCIADGAPFGVVQLTAGQEVRTPQGQERFANAGTMASVERTLGTSPGLLRVACRGGQRFRVVASERRTNGLWMAHAELVEPDRALPIPSELRGAAEALARVLDKVALEPEERRPVMPPLRMDECGWVANRWCDLLPLALPQKQNLLMLDNPLIRLELLHDLLDEHGLIAS